MLLIRIEVFDISDIAVDKPLAIDVGHISMHSSS
jgi:hypothetical protein